MPRLLTLSGEPLDWPTLHAMNEAWYRAHDQRPRLLASACTYGRHDACGGRAYPTSSRLLKTAVPCECECHG